MELILSNFEIKPYGFFNVFAEKKENKIRFIANNVSNETKLIYELTGNFDLIKKNFKNVILKNINENADEVNLSHVFKYGRFNQLIDHNLNLI